MGYSGVNVGREGRKIFAETRVDCSPVHLCDVFQSETWMLLNIDFNIDVGEVLNRLLSSAMHDTSWKDTHDGWTQSQPVEPNDRILTGAALRRARTNVDWPQESFRFLRES